MNSKPVSKTKNPARSPSAIHSHVPAFFILLAICLVSVGLLAAVIRAQNPNCTDLKRRLDDATRAYQTVLLQSQTADKHFASYQATVTKLRSDLVANDKKSEQATKDLALARNDRTRCERNPDTLPTGGCANVTQRIVNAEKIIAYASANQNKLEADLADNQQRLALVKATLSAANANLTSAQQDLDAANQAYTTAGCVNDKK